MGPLSLLKIESPVDEPFVEDPRLCRDSKITAGNLTASPPSLVAEEIALRELRKAHHRTQASMAKQLGISQDGVSRLEKRSDLLLSTLRNYVEAMGGNLNLVAEFPDQPPVMLTGFSDIDDEPSARR